MADAIMLKKIGGSPQNIYTIIVDEDIRAAKETIDYIRSRLPNDGLYFAYKSSRSNDNLSFQYCLIDTINASSYPMGVARGITPFDVRSNSNIATEYAATIAIGDTLIAFRLYPNIYEMED